MRLKKTAELSSTLTLKSKTLYIPWLMLEQGLQAVQPRRFAPCATDSRHGQQMSQNLLLERAIKTTGFLFQKVCENILEGW